MLHERFDSHEQYQQALLDRLDQDVPKLLPLLHVAYRYSRLIEFAHCFHSAVARDPTLFSLMVRDTSSRTSHPYPLCTWTHHQDLHWKSVYEFRSTPEDDKHVRRTRGWIDVTIQLLDHSVMSLLIPGKLRTSQMTITLKLSLSITKSGRICRSPLAPVLKVYTISWERFSCHQHHLTPGRNLRKRNW